MKWSISMWKVQERKRVWLVFLFWLGLGLLTSAPGLFTRTLYYDEIFETRMALMPISAQIVQYLEPEHLDLVASPPLYHILLHPLLLLFW